MRMFLAFSMTSLTSFNDAADAVKLHAKTGYYSDYILFHYSGVLVQSANLVCNPYILSSGGRGWNIPRRCPCAGLKYEYP